ncbi:MAG: hypothetical protein WCI91_04055 [Candidatus Nomurabacteria bacterium]
MDKKYLPSKIFVIKVVVIIVIAATIFGTYKIFSYFKNRPKGGKVVKLLFKNVVQKDSNNNGIPDWEEALWGLDPTKDGASNKEFIDAKKKTMSNSDTLISSNSNLNLSQNDQLAREFFSIIMSLQASGTLDDKSINDVANSIGQKIAAAPIADIYIQNMLTIKEDSLVASVNYFNQFKALTEKYADSNIGDELVFISEGLKKNDTTAMKSTKSVADAYKEFGKELMKIPVPAHIAERHLSLANNYEKTGESLNGLTVMLDNPMEGMKSIINYKNYSDGIVSDINYIKDNLHNK